MEARRAGAIVFAVLAAGVSLGADYRTPNFVINAPTPELAQECGLEAERLRKALALEWLGKEMPNWFQPCPVSIDVDERKGAGGETSFVFDRGEVFGWRMEIQGSRERLLDSVLPHEITHTVFASHFRQALPRWADEGACTTVEHPAEQRRHHEMLIQFLQTNRGLAFNRMFAMMNYPQDIMPLYAQGHSVSRYLIEQGGKRKYVDFVGDGLKTRDWPGAVRKHYGVRDLGVLQVSWLDWVKQGSPPLARPEAPVAQLASTPTRPQAQSSRVRGQSADPVVPERAVSNELPAAGEPNVAWPPKNSSPLRRAASPAKTDAAAAPQQDASGSTIDIPIHSPRKVLLEWDATPTGNSPVLPSPVAADSATQGRVSRRAPLLDAGMTTSRWR
jgi:hypothetical protein